MAVIHVPPKACPLCAEYEVEPVVPLAGTTRGKARVRDLSRRLEIPFLRVVERLDRSSGVPPRGGAGPWRPVALRSVT